MTRDQQIETLRELLDRQSLDSHELDAIEAGLSALLTATASGSLSRSDVLTALRNRRREIIQNGLTDRLPELEDIYAMLEAWDEPPAEQDRHKPGPRDDQPGDLRRRWELLDGEPDPHTTPEPTP